MKPTSHLFNQNVDEALGNANLRVAMERTRMRMPALRKRALQKFPDFRSYSDASVETKNHTLAYLDFYLEEFERNVVAWGGNVHWCEDYETARRVITDVCRSVDARLVTKGKSMVSEELDLNRALEDAGLTPVETDIGDHILQLAGERPSHLVGPAGHKPIEQIAELFFKHHKKYGKTERLPDEPGPLAGQARDVLRSAFFEADVGITGANFLIAETGTAVIVTNEGNGELTQSLPKVHVVVATIDKILPTLDDCCTVLRLLGRSATGQELTNYTTFATGPRREGDADGPEQFHVVLLDAGRSDLIGTDKQPLLRCIRCAACLNHCPVYYAVGGHAYGWVYPGPIGAALNPALLQLKNAVDLPRATSICGACDEVCPQQIPLTQIMHNWRNEAFETGLVAARERLGLRLWGFVAQRPRLYRLLTNIATRVLGWLGRSRGRFSRLPFASGWTGSRDLPAPQGGTFQAQWHARQERGPGADADDDGSR